MKYLLNEREYQALKRTEQLTDLSSRLIDIIGVLNGRSYKPNSSTKDIRMVNEKIIAYLDGKDLKHIDEIESNLGMAAF